MDRTEFDICLVNRKEYFECRKAHETWIKLPMTEDALMKAKRKIGGDKDGTIFFPNARTSFDLIDSEIFNGVFSDVDTLNKYAKQLLEIPVSHYKIINFLLNDTTDDIDEAFEIYDMCKHLIPDTDSFEEIIYQILEHEEFLL